MPLIRNELTHKMRLSCENGFYFVVVSFAEEIKNAATGTMLKLTFQKISVLIQSNAKA
jgi:hypothetical protein